MDNGQGKNKVLLIILDGLGAAPDSQGNAVSRAFPVNLIKYWDSYPHTYLQASGPAVGLPEGVYGNSEVGHMNIGAGKIILQNLPKINKAITTNAYSANMTLLKAVTHAHNNESNIHILGNLSDGGVHSHIDHFKATQTVLKEKGFRNKLYYHVFTDGRDAGQKSAEGFLHDLENHINKEGIGKIASLVGRAFAMDRNQKWERTKKAYDLITNGDGQVFNNWREALNSAYNSEQVDEYIEPTIIPDAGEKPVIRENDVVLFLNFRADRALQLTDSFLDPNFENFPTVKYNNIFFASMVSYRKNYPENSIMPKETVSLSLGRIVSEAHKRQLRIAESEKFPHVTYFFNGGNSIKYDGEDRIEIPSPTVTTYDLKPEMSAMTILEVLRDRIVQNTYDFIVLNLANTDMVGHTGNLEACIKSVKVVDQVVAELTRYFMGTGGTVIITADHGNVEEVLKLDTGEIDTEHSLNPVPFIIVNNSIPKRRLPYGKLSDIAPTILQLMGLREPDEMSGESLLTRKE